MITIEDGHMLTTVGLDLGDKTIQWCFVNHHGEVVEESRLKATGAALRWPPCELPGEGHLRYLGHEILKGDAGRFSGHGHE